MAFGIKLNSCLHFSFGLQPHTAAALPKQLRATSPRLLAHVDFDAAAVVLLFLLRARPEIHDVGHGWQRGSTHRRPRVWRGPHHPSGSAVAGTGTVFKAPINSQSISCTSPPR